MDLRAAVEAHPSVRVTRDYREDPDERKIYDLREIALDIIDRDYPNRMMDWWNAPMREPGSFMNEHGTEPTPALFLSFELELAAYRLICAASVGNEYTKKYAQGFYYLTDDDDEFAFEEDGKRYDGNWQEIGETDGEN